MRKTGLRPFSIGGASHGGLADNNTHQKNGYSRTMPLHMRGIVAIKEVGCVIKERGHKQLCALL